MAEKTCNTCRWWELTALGKTMDTCYGNCYAFVPDAMPPKAEKNKISAGHEGCPCWTDRTE